MRHLLDSTIVPIPSELHKLFPNCTNIADAWRSSYDGVHMLRLARAVARDDVQRREVRHAAMHVAAAIDRMPQIASNPALCAYVHVKNAAYDAAGFDEYADSEKTMPPEYKHADAARQDYKQASREALLRAAMTLREPDTHLLELMNFYVEDPTPNG